MAQREGGRLMVAWLAEGGWVVAGVGALGAALGHAFVCARAEAIARAVHELRGPLTAARLGLALGARTGELPPARLRAVDLELKRAAMALDDLGALGRGSVRSVPRRQAEAMSDEFDLAPLLADSVEAWRPAAEAAGAALELEWRGGPARVRGEPVRLAQATGNLIHNAIEHGGGAIDVRGWSVSGRVRVEVTDGGPGLPAPVAELAQRPRAGRGLHGRGLAIACEVARAHGGRIAAAPSRRGARLVLELPLAGGPPTPASGDPRRGVSHDLPPGTHTPRTEPRPDCRFATSSANCRRSCTTPAVATVGDGGPNRLRKRAIERLGGGKEDHVGKSVRNELQSGRLWVTVPDAIRTRVAGLLPPSHPGSNFG